MNNEYLKRLNLLSKLKHQKNVLESQGYKVAYICLYGSQNYGLDTYTEEYQSDIDMKAIIVPTLDDLINNSKPISTTVDTECGLCDLKDIRPYFETLLKANPAYIETLFTDYYIVDEDFEEEFDKIFSLREEFVKTMRVQLIRTMYGMACEKQKALCHPYPTIAHKIEKWGYDGKQAHHVQRLWLMMQDYYEYGLPFEECMFPSKEEIPFLMNLKLNQLPLDFVQEYVNDTIQEMKEFRDNFHKIVDENKIDDSIKNEFINLSHSIIKNKIVNELRKSND